MKWTISKVKEELPDILVRWNEKIYYGRISGRKLDYATVTIWPEEIKKSNNPFIDFPYAWGTIVNCLNNSGILNT